jgi:hypothetical protein
MVQLSWIPGPCGSPARADFLLESFLKGSSYSHLNNLRSAISSSAPPFDGIRIGQNELITSPMAKMERLRLPEPR